MYNISLITGDGIGPELSESVISVLETIHDKFDVKTKINSLEAGDAALEKFGHALPDEWTSAGLYLRQRCYAQAVCLDRPPSAGIVPDARTRCRRDRATGKGSG